LILIGGISAGALTGCAPGGGEQAPIASDTVYTNNFHVPGVGYYHAPFRAWYPLPYNHFDPKTRRYFYGGQWGEVPFETITNLSSPTPQVAAEAEAGRTDITRGGFGSSSGSYWISS
jgi:hypothetical protein